VKKERSLLLKSKKTKYLLLAVIIFAGLGAFGYGLYQTKDISNTDVKSSAASNSLADLNTDNNVNIQDLSILISKWSTNSQPADINKDGVVNVQDLSILISSWGQVSIPSGEPSVDITGSFTERVCTRTYLLSGMQIGATGDPVANGNRMRTVLGSAQPGDCITVSPGKYMLSGNIEFTVQNVTLKGLGNNREDVWFEHTTETRALFMVKAGGVHFYNFTHRVNATSRSSLGQSGEGNIWAQGGHNGFRMQDVLAWGSRDAAVFLYGVNNFQLNRVESRDSKSDAYHITNGSSYGALFDCISRNSGDDGVGLVGYGSSGSSTPHHHTIVRHHVAGQSWGRGIGIIHVNNIFVYGPTLIEDSAGAAVIIAREAQYGSGGISNINFYGELRLRRSNSLGNIGHGAILINNPDTVAPIESVLITGPVIIADTRTSAPGQVRAFGAGFIQGEIRNVKFYGTGPSSKLYLSLASGSQITTPGWSASSIYEATEPPFPL